MVVKAILAKTPFLTPKWVEKRVKAKKGGKRLTFPDFLAFLDEQHDYSITSHVSSHLGQNASEAVQATTGGLSAPVGATALSVVSTGREFPAIQVVDARSAGDAAGLRR